MSPIPSAGGPFARRDPADGDAADRLVLTPSLRVEEPEHDDHAPVLLTDPAAPDDARESAPDGPAPTPMPDELAAQREARLDRLVAEELLTLLSRREAEAGGTSPDEWSDTRVAEPGADDAADALRDASGAQDDAATAPDAASADDGAGGSTAPATRGSADILERKIAALRAAIQRSVTGGEVAASGPETGDRVAEADMAAAPDQPAALTETAPQAAHETPLTMRAESDLPDDADPVDAANQEAAPLELTSRDDGVAVLADAPDTGTDTIAPADALPEVSPGAPDHIEDALDMDDGARASDAQDPDGPVWDQAPQPDAAPQPHMDDSLEWEDHHDDPGAEPMPWAVAQTPPEQDIAEPQRPQQAALDHALAPLDEEALRTLISDVVRQELQGALGERITRNVRKLVRREIHRVMMSQEWD